jgi:hypothetical protein
VKQYCLMLVAFIAISGCSTTTATEQKGFNKTPLAAIEFEQDSAKFNNVPAVRKHLNNVSRFGMVAYAGSREEYELAYERFKVISESIHRTGLLHVKHPSRLTEKNKVLIFDHADMSALKSSGRFVVLPEGKTLLNSEDYRAFQREALRQHVGLQSGSIYQQLKALGGFYGWAVIYRGDEAPHKSLSLSSLEVAFIENQPNGQELKSLISEVLTNAQIDHIINIDVKRRVMEIQI